MLQSHCDAEMCKFISAHFIQRFICRENFRSYGESALYEECVLDSFLKHLFEIFCPNK